MKYFLAAFILLFSAATAEAQIIGPGTDIGVTITGSNNFTLTLTVTQLQPSWSAGTPKGTKIASLSVTRSDSLQFTGHYIFTTAHYNDGLQTAPDGGTTGVFAITINPDFTGNLIINPNGPGLEQNVNVITDFVSLQAEQP